MSPIANFNEKYRKQIEDISNEQGVDLGVARDMFISRITNNGNPLSASEPVLDYYKQRERALVPERALAPERVRTPNYKQIATQQVSPGFQRAQTKLEQTIEGKRRTLPQALGAR